jgi:hypothetical protein
MDDTDRLAALLDAHWLFRTDDGVFRCTADDWTLAPNTEIAEGDRVYPFTQHIAARLIAAGVGFVGDADHYPGCDRNPCRCAGYTATPAPLPPANPSLMGTIQKGRGDKPPGIPAPLDVVVRGQLDLLTRVCQDIVRDAGTEKWPVNLDRLRMALDDLGLLAATEETR